MIDEVSQEDPTEDMVETEQVLRTNLFSCLELQSKNSLSAIHFQRYCQFLSNHTGSNAKNMWYDQSFFSEPKLLQNSAQKLMYSMENSQPVDMRTSPYSELKDLYCHFKVTSSFSAGAKENRHCDLTKISHDILKDTFGYLDSSDTMTEEGSKVPSFMKFPDEMCDANEFDMSVSDCIYDQDGQLVRMFVCFDIEHSDTSSIACSSDSGCKNWESDCEDFIVFDNSYADDSHCCTRFDFVCETCKLHKETFAKSVVLSSNLYCEVSVMESFDNKLDSFVHEILQPNMCFTSKELILHKTSSEKEDANSRKDFISRSTTGKTVSPDKRKKKVCFKLDHELAVVHPMVVWNFAYRQARKGTWEVDALDRLRFQKRIKELDEILTPVLLAKMEKILLP